MLILLLGWILYRTLITPKRRGIDSLKQSLKNVDFQIGSVLGEEVVLRGGADEAQQIEDHLKKLILKIPSEQDVPKVIDQLLTTVGKGLPIDYRLIQPRKLEREGRYKRLPIELKFATTYDAFNVYLSQLKSVPEMFRVDSLDMRRSHANPEVVEVHLMLSAFVMPGEGEAKAQAIVDTYPKKVSAVSPFTPKRIPPPKTRPEAPKLELETPVVGEPELKLQGIIQGDIKAALINDMIVHVDTVIEGYRVINIKTESVVLKKGRRIKILKIENSLY
jgi:Tfp pilus assembly protein PilO